MPVRETCILPGAQTGLGRMLATKHACYCSRRTSPCSGCKLGQQGQEPSAVRINARKVLGPGFQRAWQTEMGPGNPKGNRASAPKVNGLDSRLQRLQGCYIQRYWDLMQVSSLFWVSASSSAKPEHLLVIPWFPPGFKSLIWS